MPTNALKLYNPQGHTSEISLRLVPLNTISLPLDKAKFCAPTPIGIVNTDAPAGAWKLWAAEEPDETVTVPADLSSDTTKTESAMSCQPLGRPIK